MDPLYNIDWSHGAREINTWNGAWQGIDAPVTKTWMDVKILTTEAQSKQIFIKGTYERITPLRYEGTFDNNHIWIYEKEENLNILLPATTPENWRLNKITAMIGSNVFKIQDFNIGHGMVEVPCRIPTKNSLLVGYQFDILYDTAVH